MTRRYVPKASKRRDGCLGRGTLACYPGSEPCSVEGIFSLAQGFAASVDVTSGVGRRPVANRTRYEQKILKPKHVCPFSYCFNTQDTRPGVCHEGQHLIETVVRVARGGVSFCVAFGRSYRSRLGVCLSAVL